MNNKVPYLRLKDAQSILKFYYHFGIPLPRGMKAILKRIKQGKRRKADINKLRELIINHIGGDNAPSVFTDSVFKPVRKYCKKIVKERKDA